MEEMGNNKQSWSNKLQVSITLNNCIFANTLGQMCML